jgi:RHS repeat-associated protein
MNPPTHRSFGKVARSLRAAAFGAAALCAGTQAHAQSSNVATAPGGSIAIPESGAQSASNALALAEVDPSTGIMRAAYPFDLETPRGKVKFSLGLDYSSAAGVGYAGYGWSLRTEEIHRIHPSGHLGAPTYSTPGDSPEPWDRFSFGDEQLVPICITLPTARTACTLPAGESLPSWATGGWQYYRLENEGAFARFFLSPDRHTWVVEYKDGLTLQLGAPLESATDYSGIDFDGKSIYRWNIVRRLDELGGTNEVVYQWAHPGTRNIGFLTDVYDTPGAGGGAHRTHFDYEKPENLTASYSPRWSAIPDLRLKTVTITSAAITSVARELVRRYHLTYEEGNNTTFGYYSLLTSVQLEGNCPGQPIAETAALQSPGPTCYEFPATQFDYFDTFQSALGGMVGEGPALNEGPVTIVDFNGDSLPDFVTPAQAPNKPQNLYLNSALTGHVNDFTLTTIALSPQQLGPTTPQDFLTYSESNHRWANIGNWLGDGNINVLWTDGAQNCAVYSASLPGNQGVWSGSPTSCLGLVDPTISATGYNNGTAFGDLNGDGLVDVASCITSATYPRSSRLSSRDQNGNITPFLNSVTTQVRGSESCYIPGGYPLNASFSTYVVDMNGDGQGDLLNIGPSTVYGTTYLGLQVFSGLGDGTFANDGYQPGYNPNDATTWNAAYDTIDYPGQLVVDDVTGDGFADLAYFDKTGVEVYLGEPNPYGGTQFAGANVGFAMAGQSSTWDPNVCSLRAADMDGSGSDDVVVICPSTGGLASVAVQSYNTQQVPMRALRAISNGQGATTTIQYQSVAQLEIAAQAAGAPWTLTSPQPFHAVTQILTSNNLPGSKVEAHGVNYSYQNPVYDGDQQLFRGFRQVTESPFSAMNDGATLPSVTTSYLVGSCEYDLHVSCVGQIDEPLDSLRGLPTLVETFVGSGSQAAYASTEHFSYQLEKLYTGLDGRFVRFAWTEQTDQFLYDTTPFIAASSQPVYLPGIDAIDDTGLTLPAYVPPRAAYSEIRSRRAVDGFGNVTHTWLDGNVTASPPDQTIDGANAWTAYGPDGWWWRSTATAVYGEGGLPGTRISTVTYDGFGRPTVLSEWLEGSLPLQRFHEDPTQNIAPTLPTASGAGFVTVATMAYDGFGNLTHATTPDGGCYDVGYDPIWSQLPTITTVHVGPPLGQYGCGDIGLTTARVFDRGLEQATMTTDPTGAVSFATYDGLGRPLTVTRPGTTSAVSTTFAYPDPPAGSLVRLTHVTDNVGDAAGSTRDAWIYNDGFGRSVLTVSHADTSAGDGGPWIASGLPDRDGVGHVVRSYLPGFYSGDPMNYPLVQPTNAYSSQTTYERFGRASATYDLDGAQVSRAGYHALSIDSFDARQIASGQQPSVYTRDGHGHLASVLRLAKPDSVEQLFTYDALGEVLSISQVHFGTSDPPVTRWMQYDTLGRLVLNAEANTSVGFSPNPSSATAMKAWRYAYDDAGRLVGTSDARGCGENFAYDAGGRPVYEDYSPCLKSQALYTAPTVVNGVPTGDGTEVFNVYDAPEAGQTTDYGGNASYLFGNLVASYDRSSHTRYAYDVRGRVTEVAKQLAYVAPGQQLSQQLAGRYTPWWYRRGTTYDGFDRPVLTDTGADVAKLLGSDGASTLRTTYTARGVIAQVTGSYGTLLKSQAFAADGFMTQETFGDVATTTGTFTPNGRRLVWNASFSRAAPALWSQPTGGYVPPTSPQVSLQTMLANWTFTYGPDNAPTEIDDGRIAGEWPNGAKPVSRIMPYDNFGRLQGVNYTYPTGTDPFVSPLEAEAQSGDTNVLPFAQPQGGIRPISQAYTYDWLGNVSKSLDDVADYWDRSIGVITSGTATAGPNRLVHAQTPSAGTVDATYDGAGNTVNLDVVRGTCGTGAICAYRFVYDWDEVGQLARARRWDFNSALAFQTSPAYPAVPPATANVDLRYSYDGGGDRVLQVRTSINGALSTNAEIFPTLRLDNTTFDENAGDYVRNETTESVYLGSPAGTLGRVVYDPSLPSAAGALHVFLEIGDHLGSATTVIDKDTSELVERITYQAYGAAESDYRPTRWASYRETYRFTGKEDDIDVGLTYFGARYYSPAMARWISADPLAIHGLGADLNPYRYVMDSPLAHVDPSGLLGSEIDTPAPSDGGPDDGGGGYGIGGNQGLWHGGSFNPGKPPKVGQPTVIGRFYDGQGTITILPGASRPTTIRHSSGTSKGGGPGHWIPMDSYDIWMSGTPEVDVAEFFVAVEVTIMSFGYATSATAGAFTASNRLFMMAAMDQAYRGIATKGTIDSHTQMAMMGVLVPELGAVTPLALKGLGLLEAEVADVFAAHFAMRAQLGLKAGEGTLARLEVAGQEFWGINAHGQGVAPLSVNAISATHAEADAFAQAARAGVSGGTARLVVDRALCPACGTFGAVRSMARQIGLDSVDVVTPTGTFTLTP